MPWQVWTHKHVRILYSRVQQGLDPGIPLRAAIDIGGGLLLKRSFSPLRRIILQGCGGRPFLSSPRGGFVFLLLLVLFGGRMGIGVFGFCVRGTMAMEGAPGLLGLLLGLFLWRFIWRRDQHLRQEWAGRFFWQRGRTVDPPRLLCPAIGNLWETH